MVSERNLFAEAAPELGVILGSCVKKQTPVLNRRYFADSIFAYFARCGLPNQTWKRRLVGGRTNPHSRNGYGPKSINFVKGMAVDRGGEILTS